MKDELTLQRSDVVNFFKEMHNEIKFRLFCQAILQNNKEMCQILLDSGYDINFRESTFRGHRNTVLTLFSGNPKLELGMAKWLIEHGADVNLNNICEKHTPLYLACYHNRYDLVKLYLQNGAKVTVDTIITTIEKRARVEILEEQLKVASNSIQHISIEDSCAIYRAITFGAAAEDECFEKIKLLLECGLPVDSTIMLNYLKMFVKYKKIEAVKYLLEHYSKLISINDKLPTSWSDDASIYLCDIAVEHNDIDMLNLLKEYGGHTSTKKEKVERISELIQYHKHDTSKRQKLVDKLSALALESDE